MNINFETSTRIEDGFFIKPFISNDLKVYPELYSRFCAALYMATMAYGNSDSYQITSEARKSAYLRSALAEFTSIIDVLGVLMPHIPKHLYSVDKSNDALYHMFKLLRNYNIHLTESSLDQKSINVLYLFDMKHEHKRTVDYISNLSVAELRRLYSAQRYSEEDLEELVYYFECQQHEFGVQALIQKGIIDYSEHILSLLRKSGPN